MHSYVIHSALHRGRKDAQCVMHCHQNAITAVSCLQDGFLDGLNQNAMIVGKYANNSLEHPKTSMSLSDDETSLLSRPGGLP